MPSYYPLTSAQTDIWIAQALDPESPAYNIGEYIEISGAVDPQLLRSAIRRVYEESDALRLRFIETEDGPRQFVAQDDALDVPYFDLSEDANPRVAAQARMRRDIETPGDLAYGPLCAFAVFKISANCFFYYHRYHHIVFDGYSGTLFARRVGERYASLLASAPHEAQDPDSWLDILRDEESYRNSPRYARDRDYWMARLADHPERATLSGRPPAVVPPRGFVRVTDFLPHSVAEKLRAVAADCGASLAQLFTAAAGLYLHRFTGERDIVLGMPASARVVAKTGDAQGTIVNVLPLRLTIDPEPNFKEFLREAARTMRDAFRHQRYRSEDLRHDFRMRSNDGFHGLIVNVISFDFVLDFAGSPAQIHNISNGPVFELSVNLYESQSDRGLRIDFNGNPEHYDIDCLSSHIRRLLALLSRLADSAQDAPIGELSLLGEDERRRVLYEWNATAADYPRDRCVHELFAAQAARTPEAVAVVWDGGAMSYAELDARANALAHRLIAHGAGPGAWVAIVMERSLALIVAELAVLKSGAAYAPLDPDFPQERLAFMIADCGAKIVLAEKGAPALPAGEWLRLEVNAAEADAGGVAAPDVGVCGDDAAYVMYTSGSTGEPKGVVVPHRAINRLALNNGYAAIGAGDRVAFAANPAFDATTFELWTPLLNGGAAVLIDKTAALDPERFGRALKRHCVDALWLTAGLFNRYAPILAEELSRLRYLLIGGEALDPKPIAALLRRAPPRHLLNGYGPTETTTFAATYEIAEIAEDAQGVPIGRPIANTRIYILDGRGEPVPIGAAGEIYIGGDGVARGYLNRPDLTAERFVPDPFAEAAGHAGARMYRTGDLGRFRPDGNIEFLGRLDDQVKIRGFRIELGEIEAALGRHAAVREAAVVAREDLLGDSPGEKRLVAYVVAAAEAPEELAADLAADLAAELRRHLRARLPDYMIPAAFVRLEALPLTKNGKLDKKALPAPDEAAFARGAHEEPQGPVETAIAALWAELLGVARVGRGDNFFELGGHSLLAISVIERMRRQGWGVEARALFLEPTLEGFAATVAGAPTEVAVPPNLIPSGCETITPEMLPLIRLTAAEIARVTAATPGGAANVQDVYPLAPLQEGILFHHLLARDGDPYLLFGLLSFADRGRLDAYAGALQAVVDRHDILRTAVLWEGLPEPVQAVWRRARIAIEERPFEASAGETAEEAASRFVAEVDPRNYRLDIRRAPLLRLVAAYDEGRGRWLALLLFHHLAMDHTTLEVAQREIGALLAGRGALLPTPVPFRNFVARARLGVPREEHDAYFGELLGDVEEPTAPYGATDVLGDGSAVAEAHLSVEESLALGLRARARALGVSAASLAHLAWAQVLARVSGRDDVVFGTVLFGRMQGGEGADEALGLFINTLPARILIGEEGVADAARRAHAQLARLLRHEHASLALAQRCSGVAASTPLFTALLNYRHIAAEETREAVGEETREEMRDAWAGIELLMGEERTNYPLVLSVNDLGEGFSLTAQARAPIDPARICAYMRTALERLVEALERAPQTPLRSLDVLPEEERRTVLYEWNATAADYPHDKCTHQLFEEQAARAPDAVAVMFESQSLTYGELDRRANQLAHHLIALGVGPETLVGVCLERSLDLVVALLGVLKAGAAYLPLDPSYPEARLAFMLWDARAPVLLTQQTLLDRLPAFGNILCIDRDWPSIAALPDIAPDVRAGPDDLAYVIYTSGSTGTPKGVPIAHRNLSNLVSWHQQAYEVTPSDRATQIAGLSFDASVWEIWPYLASGASVHIASDEMRLDPSRLARWLAERRITLTFLPTPLAEAILFEDWPEGRSLRALLTGGDRLNRRPAGALPFRVVNHYGPTENTVVSTCADVSAQDALHRAPPIGRPLPNTRVYVVDAHLRPAPIGAPGEIVLGGAQLATGYLNRPDLTAERFVPDPFAEAAGHAGARMYRTGDLGRFRPDGNIEFLGRLDDQVKIRGFRIELGEIEAALGRHALVREAAVIAREDSLGDSPGEKRLVAYVVTAADAPDDLILTLRTHLRANLPDYMIPAAFVRLEALPLTKNGKLDKKALPAPDRSPEQDYIAPRTPIEEIVAGVWADALGLEQVGADGNFFELGGHSLLAMKALTMLRERTGIDVPVRLMFESPTPAALAERLKIQDPTMNGAQLTANEPMDSGELLPEPEGAYGGTISIDEILERQRAYVKTWTGFRSSPDSFIVTMNETGSRKGLFWCLQGYRELTQLAEYLESDQPVHGMRSGHLIMDYTEENVRALARRYVDEMIALQPEGSFLVGGNCQAGLIATAIARLLQELGREVSLLFLMEQGSFPSYDGQVALLFGRDSFLNPYIAGAKPDETFRSSYPAGYTVDIISGAHGHFFESPNVETLAEAISRRLEHTHCLICDQ